MEQTALLASPVYIGQAQGEEKNHIKRGAKGLGASLLPLRALFLSFSLFLSSLCIFLVGMPSCLEDVFSYIF